VRCADCFGRGSSAGLELDDCHDCHAGEGPCRQHMCRRCNGSGVVCPLCRGDRRVRAAAWSNARTSVDLLRCPLCCEGNNVNAAIEMRAVQYFLATGDIPQSVPELHQGLARLAHQGGNAQEDRPIPVRPTSATEQVSDDADALALQAEVAELERRLWVARDELAARLGRERRRMETIRLVHTADVVDADAWTTDGTHGQAVWDRGESQ
jgi:hypothetical protein